MSSGARGSCGGAAAHPLRSGGGSDCRRCFTAGLGGGRGARTGNGRGTAGSSAGWITPGSSSAPRWAIATSLRGGAWEKGRGLEAQGRKRGLARRGEGPVGARLDRDARSGTETEAHLSAKAKHSTASSPDWVISESSQTLARVRWGRPVRLKKPFASDAPIFPSPSSSASLKSSMTCGVTRRMRFPRVGTPGVDGGSAGRGIAFEVGVCGGGAGGGRAGDGVGVGGGARIGCITSGCIDGLRGGRPDAPAASCEGSSTSAGLNCCRFPAPFDCPAMDGGGGGAERAGVGVWAMLSEANGSRSSPSDGELPDPAGAASPLIRP